MRKLSAALIVAMMTVSGAAFAADAMMMKKDHMMNKDSKFTMIDTDKDGYISKDELAAYHNGMFDKKDTNHDGKISKAEFEAHGVKHMGMTKKSDRVNTTENDKATAKSQ